MLMRTPHRWVRPKRQLPPGFIVPCQPTLADKVPDGDGWIHELKHDGFRILAFKNGDIVRLWSRNGRDWSAEFVAITEAVRAFPFKRVMYDGEAVGPSSAASLGQLVEATGWLPHTTRAALTRLRQSGHDLGKEKRDTGETLYRIAAPARVSGSRKVA
jgi:bifunctional non-homologous end joining protein LigD